MTRVAISLACIASVGLASSAYAFRLPGNIGDVIETGKLITEATTQPDQDQEREIGQGVAATLLGAAPLLPDRAVQEYVNKVGYWVALQSNRPSLPWRFAVLDIDAVNAFATPGGYIFVTKGLLLNLRNEDELAAVLAHEIAHVMQQHHLKALQSDASLKLGGKVASRAIGVGGLEGEALKLVAKGAKTLYSRGLDKEDEFEADRIGVVLAARAGYDPYGLPSVLHTLSSLNPGSNGLGLLLQTHPRPADRMVRLDQAMGTRFDATAARPLIRQRYFTSLASIAGMPVTVPQAAPAPASAAPESTPQAVPVTAPSP